MLALALFFASLGRSTLDSRPLALQCYYVGAADDAATGLVREVTQPLSRFLPADAVCNKLKKKDSQICELEYGSLLLSSIHLGRTPNVY